MLMRAHIPLLNNDQAIVRPLCRQDEQALGTFFLGLSEATRRRYGPHPFDRETARQLCLGIDAEHPDRFVVLIELADGDSEIIGYMIVSPTFWGGDRQRYEAYDETCLPWMTTVCLAPVIADAYQSRGIGTPMAMHVLRSARTMGFTHMILMGGVQATNERARAFYRKLGFQEVGEFLTNYGEPMNNYDMMLTLDDIEPLEY